MAFPEYVKDAAFRRSGRRCECRRPSHGHGRRCPTQIWRHRNVHYHHVNAYGEDILSNCEALCIKCHKLTHSYGRPKF
jgi:hypothetical protein